MRKPEPTRREFLKSAGAAGAAAAMAAAQQDPDVPPMRSPDATAVLEVVPDATRATSEMNR